MIYLDNAATTMRKPPQVAEAVVTAMNTMGNASRGAHAEALTASRIVYNTRVKLAELFHCPRPDHVVFTMNSTEALNIAIHGLLREGDHVVTTMMEHNSVLRPLYRHQNENGGSLTAEWMNSLYNDLNNRYFGPALTEDSLIQYEWARIPHFYRSFYVYQYATGYSAATAIADSILTKGAPARDAYLEFLKCGTNDYPVELLRIAGVDMDTPGPVDQAMKTFTSLVEELKGLY